MAITNGNAKGAVDGRVKREYGRRLFPQVVDDVAAIQPERECFSVPRSTDPKDGWKPVTFEQYANSINHVARRIIANCGVPTVNTFPTIAYIGPNDARYVVLVLAAVKAGYKVRYYIPEILKRLDSNRDLRLSTSRPAIPRKDS